MKLAVALGYPFAALVGACAMYTFTPAAEKSKAADAPQAATPQVALSEVTDLIDRLKPVAYHPNDEWYSNGINITFTGRDVTIKLKTNNGNEYNARARQLKDAVQMIADPAPEIRTALKGYDAEAKK